MDRRDTVLLGSITQKHYASVEWLNNPDAPQAGAIPAALIRCDGLQRGLSPERIQPNERNDLSSEGFRLHNGLFVHYRLADALRADPKTEPAKRGVNY